MQLFSAPSISKPVGISERHMRRLLQVHTGVSFGSYVKRWRIETAKSVVGESGNTTKAIAGSVGYNQATSFIRSKLTRDSRPHNSGNSGQPRCSSERMP
jgi:transcriptional regulator GlxA family with amidase domain